MSGTPLTNQHIQAMPKVELHLHLEGAMRAETILQLAQHNNLSHLLPGTDIADIQRWYEFHDFYHFAEVIRTIKDLMRSAEDFALSVYQIGADLAAQNVLYAEITVTPYTHTHALKKNLSIETILEGLNEGRRRVWRDFGVELRWIFDIPRNRSFADYKNGGDYVVGAAETTLEFALKGQAEGVIGLGLGGNELNAPPEPFAPVFAEAKSRGLLSLPHAGESQGAGSVRGALEALGADRIGHGVRAIEDEGLVDLLAERQIPLELNVSSNVYLKFYPSVADHPFPLLDQAGILVTVNTDDPLPFNTNLSAEYGLLMSEFGYSLADVQRIARNAFVASGADATLKADLLRKFDQWASS